MCLAYPYKIIEIKNEWTAVAEIEGVKTEISLHLLPEPVKEGDWVLVHVGFAIQKLSEKEALESLRAWDELLKQSQYSLE
ncbi:hydrogenase assembly chaperone hypC/hupF [Thermodesulfobacterium geofontis OPF15]|jgi:hydrogenase expression/formation protein HypC|uniref:Hydrogenase assembly chaperone hypC/hupF n=2 Tax=Thermodesulfobacterium geofontis TaxID=1295609 RepID=F8C5K2_THEGP|nr:HypC/HybG/HupF family hydrogenase formation chaperone [Thermodesulfobacterium geofontis]AEH22981.1 hydrogenase assembly chaperone hypC/hupF [Thermodesulfobacterium geofontis OPF15]